MLNILIPMAGRGSRFSNAGYELPKPLIPIHGMPMIQFVTNNIRPSCEHRFIYICQKEHLDKYGLEEKLRSFSPGCVILVTEGVTEGAACTALLAEDYINNSDSLMIANSDQFVDVNIDKYLAEANDYDGYMMTMFANDNKWSFIKINDDNLVTLVREKEVISNEATVGIYNWRRGSDFVKYAKQMILKDIRVNNEYYVAPVYNEMVEDSLRIGYYNIGSLDNGMYGLGVPDDLEKFLLSDLSMKYH